MVASTLKVGRFEVVYDPDGPLAQRVRQDGIRVGGRPFKRVFAETWNGAAPGPWIPRIEPLFSEALEAVEQLESVTPSDSLVSRDGADRVLEVIVIDVCRKMFTAGRNSEALEYCLWALHTISEWEQRGVATKRYIHKGVPYFIGGISALRCRNLEVAVMLFEAGDLADDETFRRAGVPTVGVKFPGRAFLSLDPTPNNLLASEVNAMRADVDAWLADFAATGGMPAGDSLLMADMDQAFFSDSSLRTECRYVVGYLLRTYLVDRDSTLRAVRGLGPLARRQQAEWILGLLTATEGIARRAEGTLAPTQDYFDVIAELVRREGSAGHTNRNRVKGVLGGIVGMHKGSIENCLDYWSKWAPSGATAGYPWFVRWLEPGRLIRNQAAHVLTAPTALDTRWEEIERVARFALLSSIWLV